MKNFWSKLSATGGLKKKPILALAPMAGVTDSAFRQICRKYGADVVYTEMVSADGLHYDSKKTLEFLKFSKDERPIVIQLFGKHPEKFTKAAQLAEKAGFDGIDINFGCPAKKVAGHGGGVTLMRDLEKCREIVEAVLSGTKLPVSVKIRSSINVIASEPSRAKRGNPPGSPRSADYILPRDDNYKKDNKIITALDFVRKMKGLNISAIMIHGRPYENPFNAEIDYEMIKKIKKEFPGIVLGNGGINVPMDAKIMWEKTGVDGFGIARGVYGKPWIFKQIKDYLKMGKYQKFDKTKIKKVIIQHAEAAFKSKDTHGIIELRKHLLWYVKGWENAKELRSQLVAVESLKDIKNVCKNI